MGSEMCIRDSNKALSLLDPTQRPSTSDTLPPATASELLSIPDGPLSELPPRQLHRVAQTVDTLIFVTIAFLGVFPLLPVIGGQLAAKAIIWVLAIPLLYGVVAAGRMLDKKG